MATNFTTDLDVSMQSLLDAMGSIADEMVNDRLERARETIAISKQDLVNNVLTQIQEEKLNRMRCVLTGAPYATIDSNEVWHYLNSTLAANPKMSHDQLLDSWDLVMLSMCSRVGPALMNRKRFALVMLLNDVREERGLARLITFYLTRFFYSFDHHNKGFNSQHAIDRMHFAIEWFDYLSGQSLNDLTRLAYRICADDAWLPLDRWRHMGLFSNRSRTHGIMAPEHLTLRAWTLNPSAMPVTIAAANEALDSLISILVQQELQGGVADLAPANVESIEVLKEVAAALSLSPVMIEVERMRESSDAATAAQAEQSYLVRERLTRKPVTVIHSALHGKGKLPGERGTYRKPKVEKPKVEKESKPVAMRAKGRQSAASKALASSLDDVWGSIDFNAQF